MNSAAQPKQTSTKDCGGGGNCHFNKFRRPLYYHGMLIDDKGFRDEQEYHAQKRRLINRTVHGSGVVCGLELEQQDERTFTIGCGLAFDCCGCEIYVPSEVTIRVPQPSATDPANSCPPPPKGKEVCYRIRLAFTEEDTDYQQVQLPGGNCGDKTCKPARKREGFCVDLHECDCLHRRNVFDCATAGWDIGFVDCSCGCECSCGGDHWVSIGTVGATDGKITTGPTYECRDYVISGQMLKQLLSDPDAEVGSCACPNQFERLKEILGLICKTNTRGQKLEESVDSHLRKESHARLEQIKELDQKVDARSEQMRGVMEDFYERLQALAQATDAAKHDQMLKRIEVLEAGLKRVEALKKKARPKSEEPPKA